MAFGDSFGGYFCLMLKKHVAVFDVDGTLLDGDSLLLAASHSIHGFQKIFP